MKIILCMNSEVSAGPDMCGLLTRFGFHVIRESDRHGMLFLLASGLRVDLVLLDARNTDGSDLECLRSVKKVAPHVPVIVLSRRRSTWKSMYARYVGTREYLEMPVADLDFLEIVQKATGGAKNGNPDYSDA